MLHVPTAYFFFLPEINVHLSVEGDMAGIGIAGETLSGPPINAW